MITRGGIVRDEDAVVFAGVWVFPGFLRGEKIIVATKITVSLCLLTCHYKQGS